MLNVALPSNLTKVICIPKDLCSALPTEHMSLSYIILENPRYYVYHRAAVVYIYVCVGSAECVSMEQTSNEAHDVPVLSVPNLELDYVPVIVILYLCKGFLQISYDGGVQTRSCTYMFHPTIVMW